MGRRHRRTGRCVALCLGVVVVLASCGTAQDEAAGAVAERLMAAVAGADGGAACRLLAPAARTELEDSSGQPCAVAVLEEDFGAGTSADRVAVFDTMAQVRFADDTVFLSRFDGQWLVIAAACRPRAGRPYDCDIAA